MRRNKTEVQELIEWLEQEWSEKLYSDSWRDYSPSTMDKIEEDFYYSKLEKKGYKNGEINKVMKELGYDY